MHLVTLAEDSAQINLRFFYFTRQQEALFVKGRHLRCFGEIRIGSRGFEAAHPDYEFLQEGQNQPIARSLTPVYPSTDGLHQKTLKSLIEQALNHLGEVEDLLQPLADQASLPPLHQALLALHHPLPEAGPANPDPEACRKRLAFEELLSHHLTLRLSRGRSRVSPAPVLRLRPTIRDHFIAQLPFTLTQAQIRVSEEIFHDLAQGRPMMRLVQGDVGSGKTVVAALAALAALDNGHQVALMAPTDLLAEQHAKTFASWFEALGHRVGLFTGRLRGAERRDRIAELKAGVIGLAIGTHALFQETLEFRTLSLVMIDEQHRFGVDQRLSLRNKGIQAQTLPHQLILTATPIPRTLAMTGYADLDLSIIDERPPGRTPIQTAVLPDHRKEEIIERIRRWIGGGRQVYWVCTLIEESDQLEAEAAEAAALSLRTRLKELRIALVHGRLRAQDKEAIMSAFKAGDIDLLVATTVIEVGVDVPNAGLMIIENAERLGLAQLHQLRGRIGRGPGASHCILLYKAPLGRIARERLAILRATDDGFLIAEKDLEIRGPGEFLGTRQTGQLSFRIADLSRDGDLAERIEKTADTLLASSPRAVEMLIERWIGTRHAWVEA